MCVCIYIYSFVLCVNTCYEVAESSTVNMLFRIDQELSHYLHKACRPLLAESLSGDTPCNRILYNLNGKLM